MKNLQLILTIILSIFIFTGCEISSPFSPSEKELALKEQQLTQTQKLKEKELTAKIEQEKNALQVKKDLELAKINSQLEKEKLQTQNKEKENQYQLELLKKQSEVEIQKYYIFLVAFLLLVISVACYVYFNNRRKDKLKAYEDNLEKYFRAKENQARVDVANKIIDTIASGKLNKDQETRLIATINGNSNVAQETIQKVDEEQIMELEIIDPKDKEKKKKKSKKKKKE